MISAARGRRGSLLVMTLWTVAILGMLTVAVARQLALQIRVSRYRVARLQAQTAARGGVSVAMEQLTADTQGTEQAADWLGEVWASGPGASGQPSAGGWTWIVPRGDNTESKNAAIVTVRITDEDGKLNLNRLEDPVVYESFTRLMGSTDQVDLVADYIDADSDPRPSGLEDAESPVLYRAKNAAAVTLAELGLIPGMRADTLSEFAKFASANLAAESKVNINTAPREVLAAINVPSLVLEGIIAFREQNHYFTALSPEVTADTTVPFDTAIPEFAAVVDRLGIASQTFTVTSEAVIQNPEVRVRVEAVVRRAGCGEGMPEPCIVSWSES